jgi:hypothetical protein
MFPRAARAIIALSNMKESAMRRHLRAITVLAGIAAAMTVVPAASSAASIDWMVVRYTATRSVQLDLAVAAELVSGSDRTLVYGVGTGLTGRGPKQRYYNGVYMGVYGGRSSQDVAVSASGVGTRQRVRLPDEVVALSYDRAGIRIEETLSLTAGQTFAVALFVPHGRLTYPYHSPAPAGVRKVVRTGRGSTAIRIADLRDAGVGAEAGPMGAGALVHKVKASRGLIGAADAWCNCAGRWIGPGGRAGQWSAVDTVASGPVCWCSGAFGAGDFDYVGPRGDWSWTWAGLTGVRQAAWIKLFGPSSPVIAAYAPVGEDWRYFAGDYPLLGPYLSIV